MKQTIRATPLHGRAAAANPYNRWISRNGCTLALDYGNPQAEALAARTRVVIVDISWRWRFFVRGGQAAQLLSKLATKDVAAVIPGNALKALWLNDEGAVRGAGVFARYASDQFLLVSATTDSAWLEKAATSLRVSLDDVTEREGGVALVGPYAAQVLKAAGLDWILAPLAFRRLFWRGMDITISRLGEQKGYELWCAADDAYLLWDRLMQAGAKFGIEPAGVAAMDILDIEAGVPRPVRDYGGAGDGLTAEPSPASLALESLIDEQHLSFTGRGAWLANRGRSEMVLLGIEIESDTPAPFMPLLCNGKVVGHTLTSVFSPVLRRAIALASVERRVSGTGAVFALSLPISPQASRHQTVAARQVSLPFFKVCDPISP